MPLSTQHLLAAATAFDRGKRWEIPVPSARMSPTTLVVDWWAFSRCAVRLFDDGGRLGGGINGVTSGGMSGAIRDAAIELLN